MSVSENYLKIPIGGFLKQSLIDYPGNVSAIIFTCGCNFRCRYCHNPELVYPEQISETKKINNSEIIEWIRKNRKLLDALVITGGEPTLHSSLPDFIKIFKTFGLKVKLDTNGTNPDMLEKLIKYKAIDYVAMDIKAPLLAEKYKNVTGESFNEALMNKVIRSVNVLNRNHVPFEFRTTLDESLGMDDILSIINSISGNYYIQELRKNGTVIIQNLNISELKKLNPERKDLNVHFR